MSCHQLRQDMRRGTWRRVGEYAKDMVFEGLSATVSEGPGIWHGEGSRSKPGKRLKLG